MNKIHFFYILCKLTHVLKYCNINTIGFELPKGGPYRYMTFQTT